MRPGWWGRQGGKEAALYRELFRIPTPFGDLPVFGYGAMVLFGVLGAVLLLRAGARRRQLDPDRLTDLAVLLVLFGVIGGRVWYLIQYRHEVYAGGDWLETFRLWRGGLVLYGAIAGGLIALAWLQRKRRYGPWRDLLDLIAPAVAIGIAFGRLGCYLNGCCWGEVCAADWPLAAVFPPGSPPSFSYGDGSGFSPPLYPTQLYSACQGLILALILWRAGAHLGHRPGRTFAIFLGLYSLGRGVIELIRADHGIGPGQWTVSQLVSVVVLVLAGWLWFSAPSAGESPAD